MLFSGCLVLIFIVNSFDKTENLFAGSKKSDFKHNSVSVLIIQSLEFAVQLLVYYVRDQWWIQ